MKGGEGKGLLFNLNKFCNIYRYFAKGFFLFLFLFLFFFSSWFERDEG